MTGPGNASRFVNGLVTALLHATQGRAQEAVDALKAVDPEGFVACYALAMNVVGYLPKGGGVTVDIEGVGPAGDTYYAASIAAFLAAVGNADVAGARAVFFTDGATSGRMIADLLMISVDMASGRS